uniref:proline--tRNA ligase n=1 Tax=Petromyzon marinus TaxID=7757 RepID=A0AAJ7XB76_PETMA|nr:probable proline--tRNA ligase, mitochondrial [Petromyzon marinus]
MKLLSKLLTLYPRRRPMLPSIGRSSHKNAATGRQRERVQRQLVSRLFHPNIVAVDTTEPAASDGGTGGAGTQGHSDGKQPCKSQRLMVQTGLIQPAAPGCYHLLPRAVRAVEKLVSLIDQEMVSINGHKISMPCLTMAEAWRASGRWDLMGSELFRLRDRTGADLCLGPTHEEAVTRLLAAQGVASYRQLPLRLYQVTQKFRDEPRPCHGLLRGREFLMKDLYTFDVSERAARQTYGEVFASYRRVFARLGLPITTVEASTGAIGGKASHEFHLMADVGEDQLLSCCRCGFSINEEMMEAFSVPADTVVSHIDGSADKVGTDMTHTIGGTGSYMCRCPKCSGRMVASKGIEVGHTFYLGTRYSEVFGAKFCDDDNKSVTMEMGCYGLGITRILAAAVEVLSTADSVRWPGPVAPYQVCILTPKWGSKEEVAGIRMAEDLYDTLDELFPRLRRDMLLDDRGQLTLGKRLKEADKMGLPYVVVVGKRTLEAGGEFEVLRTRDGETMFLTKDGIVDLLKNVDVCC